MTIKKVLIWLVWASITGATFAPHLGNARDGRWVQGRHGERFGYWWVVGPQWSYYNRPYVYYPNTVVVQQSPPPPVYVQPAPSIVAQAPIIQYYCKATGTYYPDTMSCPGGFQPVTGLAPPSP